VNQDFITHFIIIIMTNCYGATQQVLSSIVQQYSLYNVAYSYRTSPGVLLHLLFKTLLAALFFLSCRSSN